MTPFVPGALLNEICPGGRGCGLVFSRPSVHYQSLCRCRDKGEECESLKLTERCELSPGRGGKQ